MLIVLKQFCFISGSTPQTWEVVELRQPWRFNDPEHERHTIAQAASLKEAFEIALLKGMVQPGKALHLSGFNAIVRDRARRFESQSAGTIRLADGSTAERIGDAWRLSLDTGRGKHAVIVADGADVAAILAAAVWRTVFTRECQRLEVADVGPFLCGIAHRLLDGATSEVASHE